MSKTFRLWAVDDTCLLPPSVQEFVPAGHVAHLVRDLVRDELDLSVTLSAYTKVRGYPSYHPGMMVALLLYACNQGLHLSHRIARACEERLDFYAVTALNQPDFRTISGFRQRHLTALAGLFTQVLALCQRVGLVSLNHAAGDGTKLQTNASKHKVMSYALMVEAEADLAGEVAAWLDRAEQADGAEDAAHAERRGDGMVDWMQTRLPRIRAARAEREAEAKAARKQVRGFRQLFLGSIDKVAREWGAALYRLRHRETCDVGMNAHVRNHRSRKSIQKLGVTRTGT